MTDKQKTYALLKAQLDALLEGETDLICAMANASAAIYETLPDLNWAGFYRVVDGGLILGPFQGRVACTRIACGKGVCGTAMAAGEPQLVPDVHAFPGHIACDSASNSELVIPIRNAAEEVQAVLDLDSPTLGRFDEEDLRGLLPVAALFTALTEQPGRC